MKHAKKSEKKTPDTFDPLSPCQGARGARHPDVVLVAGYHQPVRIGAHKERSGFNIVHMFDGGMGSVQEFGYPNIDGFLFMPWTYLLPGVI